MRAHNFCAGSAAMPEEVLEMAQNEMVNWGHSGSSIMETSHRSPDFIKITRSSVRLLRELMNIPDDYEVLFMQGGATGQFSIISMNLLRGKKKADYICTGIWSYKAIEEAERYCEVNIAADSKDSNYTTVPDFADWKLDPDAAYVHYAPNETVNGVEFDYIPDTGDVPLVADMSSNILSRPVDVSKFGLIYAGAQKNIGPSGITVVIVRKDLIGNSIQHTPGLLDYSILLAYSTTKTYLRQNRFSIRRQRLLGI